MMNIEYKDFCKHMNAIEEKIRLEDSISDLLAGTGGVVELPDLVDNVILLLRQMTNDDADWINYFIFELDFGKAYEDGMITDDDGNDIKLSTLDELWNLLNGKGTKVERGSGMNITEVEKDLFLVPQGYYLAHCISGDYALGAGIAKKFNELYNMSFKLHRDYPIPTGNSYANVNRALLVDNVFNLVTKPRYYHKPTYDNVRATLEDMKEQCIDLGIKKIAMPRIAAGLDKLEWDKVKEVIEDVFSNVDIEIVICSL